MEATADELDTRISAMERERAKIAIDLTEIDTLAAGKIRLTQVNHGGSSVKVKGTASTEDDIFDYARDLQKGGRFSKVWISSITGDGKGFTVVFDLITK
jgi:hypothetical protein